MGKKELFANHYERRFKNQHNTFLQIHARAMSRGKMPNCPSSASKDFSSTPLKNSQGKDLHASKGLDNGVLSDDEDTFSLLSPIYHDSFDSEEELEPSPTQRTSPEHNDRSRLSVSPIRCELPRSPSVQMLNAAVEPAGSPALSAWEMWLVNKAKEDRFKLERLAEEEQLQKERKEQQERQQEQKKIVMEEKIQEWLRMKREQEKHQQLKKLSKEEEENRRQQEQQRETEQKAQQKYKDWLQKKNQEKLEMQKKEKEAATLKEEQEKERQKRAEQRFKEWLVKANERSRASPKSPSHPTSPYDKSYPSPSFYNPVPWKPIHVPPPEAPVNKTSSKKPQRPRKCQQSQSGAFRLRHSVSAAQLLQRR